MDKPNYYGILPASVRYDQRLAPAARLLYCELSALCNKTGFCTAGNLYFAELYQVSDRSVRGWLRQLEQGGYVRIEAQGKPEGDSDPEAAARRIWLTLPELDPGKNFPSPGKNFPQTPEKIFHKNNTSINNNKPPIVPQGTRAVFERYAAGNSDLLDALDALAADRKERRKPMTVRAAELLTQRLDKLAGDDVLQKVEMLERAVLMGWRTVYPPDEPRQTPGRPEGRREAREL